MQLEGKQLIGADAVLASGRPIHGINPATGETLEPGYPGGSQAEVERACELAWQAFDAYRETGLEERATFLESVADEIEAIGDALIERAMAESGLPRARLEGERGRTCGQLRLFARVVRDGEWLDVRVDPALPERQPMPRVDLRQRHIGLGPVTVFGASNFPLAFSVAGGDTASALAAGCPVVVKAHSAHPGTSELVGRAVQRAVAKCGLPEGVFSLLFGSGREVGQALVADPRIKAVGFTGSRSGGTALMKTAQNRPEPIPVYAEMSSINPVFLLPEALKARGAELGEAFIGSLTMGAGQFCTNPGLVIAIDSPELDAFIAAAGEAIKVAAAQTMLTPGIFEAYESGVSGFSASDKAQEVARGQRGEGPNQCQAGLFTATAADFLAEEALQAEVFGSTSLVVKCADLNEVKRVAEHLEGQLTATLQMDDGDVDVAHQLLPILERRAGRVMANGWPTGVEVCDAMVHGGPYPATSDSRTTSVGTAAIHRFLRPVCYQNLPQALLPEALRDGNPANIRRLIDGKREVS
ncbi:aldehyde dehydrogenase (NADP(+)) [Halomonas binhaiensis]|uniref:2,5-dioxovalerate dehydrogenase n=1 Tax=Halomonas binhaiensis TaxID=2562282 RepID=A0A5C1NGN5_9GAMM|nr:aldehyde dehydrogenase (NADP(+)) [Halomonas binhaiensis]QEM82416.1 aldehyde dehydrogenase (NADP(+)) [Halomonas binhaiensis]